MPSIAEIAGKLGLSKATVSRAFDLRHCGEVREETRKRIFALCEELDYHPTFAGRSFSTGKSFKIGVLVESHAESSFSPLFSLCIRALGEAVQQQGFALTVLYFNDRDSSAQIVDFLKSSIADGYILLSQLLDDYVLEAVRKCRQPVITMDYVRSGISGLPVVSRDSVAAYRTAWNATTVEERKNSAFVNFGRSQAKRESLLKAAPADAELHDIILPCSNGNVFSSYRNARTAAVQCFDALAGCRLLWCSSDILAFAVMDVLGERGITSGDRVKIAGFDNIEGTTPGFEHPVLSSVDPCWHECGRALAETVIREILEGKKSPAETAVESKFIFRSSFQGKEGVC